jgi:hypothetical protein
LVTIKLDKTAPTIDATIIPTPNDAGWHNSDVTVQFTCADVLSGVASCAADQTVTTEGADQPITGNATDIAGNAASATVNVSLDKTPPVVTCSANPDRLWPANNKLKDINVTVNVEDALSGPNGFVLVAVTNNETTNPSDMPGWDVGTADTAGQLMASRAGNGDGRIYTLTYEGGDMAGNTAQCSTIVFVPHDNNQPNPPQPTTTVVAADASGDESEDEENSAQMDHTILLPFVAR